MLKSLRIWAGRRNEPRFDAPVSAKIWVKDTPIPASGQDISASGIKLRAICSHQFEMDETYRLELHLKKRRKAVIVVGRIVRIEKHPPDDWTISFHFEEMDDEDRKYIKGLRRLADNPLDRRIEPRLSSCISARLCVLGDTTPAYTKDISASGIRIQINTPCRFDIDEQYRVEIELPRDDRIIRAQVRVVRIDQRAVLTDEWTIALEFVNIEDSDKARIKSFIARREAEREHLGLA